MTLSAASFQTIRRGLPMKKIPARHRRPCRRSVHPRSPPISARAATPRRRSLPRRSTTGPAFISAAMLGGAFSASNNFNGLALSDYDAPLPRRRAGRRRLAVRARTGSSASKASIAGSARTSINAIFPGRLSSTTTTSAASARSPAASATPRVRRCSTSRAATPIPTISETLTFGGAPVAFTLDGNHMNG